MPQFLNQQAKKNKVQSARPMQLRTYQKRVVDEVGSANAIVRMPTGSGKTFVAGECLKRAHEAAAAQATSSGTSTSMLPKGLFLVPTCELVGQQAKALRLWTRLRVSEFMGSLKDPVKRNFDILVSTPEAFRMLQMRDRAFDWGTFGLCVFDEVHHVLKDHPYRKLALALGLHPSCKNVQVIGLSASLTYAVGKAAVEKTLCNLSHDLRLTKMITTTDAELLAGGYTPPKKDIEIVHPHKSPEGVVPVDERKPHLMHTTFMMRVAKGRATDFGQQLWKVIKGLEESASQVSANFSSPLTGKSLASWETYANKQASGNSEKRSFFQYLEDWYVALRLLVQTWEEDHQLVLTWLQIRSAFKVQKFDFVDTHTRGFIRALEAMAANESNLSKLACLKQHLQEKHDRFGKGFRGIVFVEQRITAYVLSHAINEDAELQSFTSGFVAAKNTKITPSIRVSESEARDFVREFRTGRINVIVTTSVLQEGFDVPAANVLICFDQLKDSVELCQRFGRARSVERCIVVMDERKDRPISHLQMVQKQQNKLINDFTPGKNKVHDREAREKAQHSRERGAADILSKPTRPLHDLDLYRKKTKATLTESHKTNKSGLWTWGMHYVTVLRDLRAEGVGKNKKDAKRECARALLVQLRTQSYMR